MSAQSDTHVRTQRNKCRQILARTQSFLTSHFDQLSLSRPHTDPWSSLTTHTHTHTHILNRCLSLRSLFAGERCRGQRGASRTPRYCSANSVRALTQLSQSLPLRSVLSVARCGVLFFSSFFFLHKRMTNSWTRGWWEKHERVICGRWLILKRRRTVESVLGYMMFSVAFSRIELKRRDVKSFKETVNKKNKKTLFWNESLI